MNKFLGIRSKIEVVGLSHTEKLYSKSEVTSRSSYAKTQSITLIVTYSNLLAFNAVLKDKLDALSLTLNLISS